MQRSPHAALPWGTLETAYTDEYGRIAPDVYASAGRLWQQAQDYASHVLLDNDPSRVRTLLLKSTAQVTRARYGKTQQIDRLDGYLFQTFKHIVLAELEKDNNRHRFETQAHLNAEWQDQAKNVERRILLNELVEAMDGWTREIFEWLTLDYTFEDIAQHLGMDSRVVRTKYSRHLDYLMKHCKARSGVEDSQMRRE